MTAALPDPFGIGQAACARIAQTVALVEMRAAADRISAWGDSDGHIADLSREAARKTLLRNRADYNRATAVLAGETATPQLMAAE